jgi:hypothetical protein
MLGLSITLATARQDNQIWSKNPENRNMMIVNCAMMEESTNKKKSLRDKLTEEDHMMLEQEEKEKARKRTRGPYRKSSSVRA